MRLRTSALFALCLTAALADRAAAQIVDDVSHTNALTHYRFGEELFHDEQFAKAVVFAPQTRPGRYTILEHLGLDEPAALKAVAEYTRVIGH
jgi:hypothetical protein